MSTILIHKSQDVCYRCNGRGKLAYTQELQIGEKYVSFPFDVILTRCIGPYNLAVLRWCEQRQLSSEHNHPGEDFIEEFFNGRFQGDSADPRLAACKQPGRCLNAVELDVDKVFFHQAGSLPRQAVS